MNPSTEDESVEFTATEWRLHQRLTIAAVLVALVLGALIQSAL
jgi:hypothetical protein